MTNAWDTDPRDPDDLAAAARDRADRDRRRTPLDLTDDAIDRSYHASIAEMTVALASANERADTAERLLGEATRKIARLEAAMARGAREPPPWYLVALAALACAPPWLRRRLARCWPFWAAALVTAALTVAAIVALRWLGGY